MCYLQRYSPQNIAYVFVNKALLLKGGISIAHIADGIQKAKQNLLLTIYLV